MAEAFLAQLNKVPENELPEDKICVICMEEYGTAPSESTPAEEAVRLPCGHTCGFGCLSSWLTPSLNRNSCPYCRHELFTLDEDEVAEARLHLRMSEGFQALGPSMIGEGGSPELIQSWQGWFDEWISAGHHADGASVERARAARAELFARTGWSEDPPAGNHSAVLWSQTASNTDFQPLARAIQTLGYREFCLYLQCQIAHMSDSIEQEMLNGPIQNFSAEQEEWLFQQLLNEQAFNGVLEEVVGEREKWQILRSQGYSWDAMERFWTAHPC